MGFCHAHLCTNDLPYSYGLLSCTSLYGWLSIYLCMGFCHAHFCTNDYPYSYGFLSCTFMHKWLSIFFLNGFCHAHICTNDYPYSFWMGFRHAHFYANDYPFCCVWVFVMHISVQMIIPIYNSFSSRTFLYEWLFIKFLIRFASCTFLYEWLSNSFWMVFCHAHLCTNDYPFLCVWIYVTHISVRMTIHIQMGFRHAHFCRNDYFVPKFLSSAFLLK